MASEPVIDQNATDILKLTSMIKAMAERVSPGEPAAAYSDIFMELARMLCSGEVSLGFSYLGTACAQIAQIAINNGHWTVDDVVQAFRTWMSSGFVPPSPSQSN